MNEQIHRLHVHDQPVDVTAEGWNPSGSGQRMQSGGEVDQHGSTIEQIHFIARAVRGRI